jgi:hypothetical protein
MANKALVTIFVVALIFTEVFAGSKISVNYNRKQLAGAASGFNQHVIPNPTDAAVEETTAEIEVLLSVKNYTGGNDLLSQHDIICDSKHFFIVFFSPYESKVTLKLFDPKGKEVSLDGKLVQDNFPIGDTGEGVPALYVEFNDAIIGTYVLQIIALPGQVFEPINSKNINQVNAYIMTYSESPLVIFTHMNQFMLKTGKDIGLVTRIGDAQLPRNGNAPSVAKNVIVDDAEMKVQLPDGTEIQVKMHDDGLHNDFEANDGIYGATFQPANPGLYRLRADVVGHSSTGVKFLRSTQHMAPVLNNAISLTGKAFAHFADPTHVMIELLLNGAVDETYISYAEVWGISRITKKEVPICWIEGLGDLGTDAGLKYLPLNLDLSWLRLPGMDCVDYSTLFLKNVRVQDVDYVIPLAVADKVTISFPKIFSAMINQIPMIDEATDEMRKGPVPESIRIASLNRTMGTAKSGVVVIHGYCAKDNPFAQTKDVWTKGFFYTDFKKNRNHNEFSTKVIDYANSIGLDSYSFVGHSQGGMVGLNILNFFYTGADVAKNGRLVQSVGTPFYGNTGAGCLSDLINVFGFGCGANFDLSREGSALWLSTISEDTRKSVHYYTTSYGKFPYCNLLTYLILKKPNDGTAEVTYSHLQGATNEGNTDAQCHSAGMKKPPQTHDAKRNAEMNAKAAL